MIIDRMELEASAKDFANRALRAYLHADNRVILMNAACSMEHLGKAFLASLHPVLLVEVKGGNLDSLLHLSGYSSKARSPFPRTIGSREVLSRVQYALPALDVPASPLHRLIDVRDGIVHIGFLSDANTRESLIAFLRYSNALYDELDVSLNGRWGEHGELVHSLISQSLTEIEHEVQRKIAAAKVHHHELMAKIPTTRRQLVRYDKQRESYYTIDLLPGEERIVTIACPACNHAIANCTGVTEINFNADIPGEGDTQIISPYAFRLFRANRLVCGACELSLDNPDELKAAGMQTSWILDETVDPSEYDNKSHLAP